MVGNCSLLLVEVIGIIIFLKISVETFFMLFQDRLLYASPLIKKKSGSYCNLWPHVENQYISTENGKKLLFMGYIK